MLRRAACGFRCFFETDGYVWFVGALMLIGHILELDAYTMSLTLLSASAGVIASGSIRPFCVALIMFIYQCSVKNSPGFPSFSDYYYTGWRYPLFILLFVIVAAVLVYNFLRNHSISLDRIKALPYKGASLAFFTALTLSGFLSGEWLLDSMLFGLLAAFSLVILPYLMMLGLTERDRDGMLDCFLTVAEVCAVVLICETAHLYLTGGIVTDGAAEKGLVLFGWGIWTTAGMNTAVLIPLLFLGAMRTRRPIFRFVSAHLLLCCCALSLSRNALIFGTLALVLSAIAVMIFSQKARLYRKIYVSLAAVILISAPLWLSNVAALFSDFINRGLSDNGRFELWNYGVDCFLDAPIFGKGFFAIETDAFRAEHIFPPMLHNIFVTLAAATGIFGVATYILWQAATLTRLILPFSPERILLALSYVTLFLMSLFDDFTLHVQPMFLFSVLIAIANTENERLCRTAKA